LTIRFNEPVRWLLAFSRETTIPWLRQLPLCYRHVSAFGYVGGDAGVWLFFDWRQNRLQVSAARDDLQIRTLMHEFCHDADLLGMPASDRSSWGMAGGYCVPAVKHLIGLRSRALTPSGLYRDCLRAGAEIIR